MAERLEPSIVHEILSAEKPCNVQQLVNGISKRIDASTNDVVAMLRGMVRSGELRVKQEVHASCSRRFSAFLAKYPLLRSLLIQYKAEALLKAMSFIIVFNLISWIIIIAFQNVMMFAPFRIFFHGINLLFLPGFALTVLWYPFPSLQLDFTKLNRKTSVPDGRAVKDEGRARALDLPTRIAYSTCYSIGLVILIGFLIGLLGLGFSIVIMHGLFTIIEFLVIVVLIINIYKIRDPYSHI